MTSFSGMELEMYRLARDYAYDYLRLDLTESIKDWFVKCKPDIDTKTDAGWVKAFWDFVEVGALVWGMRAAGYKILLHKDGRNFELDPVTRRTKPESPVQGLRLVHSKK